MGPARQTAAGLSVCNRLCVYGVPLPSVVLRRFLPPCALALAALALPPSLAAQAARDSVTFTRQGLLITNFTVTNRDADVGRRAAAALRPRVARLSNKRDVNVIST